MPHHILLTVDVEDWFQVENLKGAIPFESWPTRELRVEKNTHRILDLLDEISDQRLAVSGQRSSGKNTVDSRQKTEARKEETEDRRQETVGEVKETEDRIQNTASSSLQASGSSLLGFDTKSSQSCKSCLKGSSENGDGQLTTDHGQHEKVRGTFFVLGWIAERFPHLVREIHARGHEVASHGFGHELCSHCSTNDLKEDLAKSKKLLEDTIGEPVYGYRAPSFSISDDILKTIGEAGYLYDSSYNSFAMHGRYGKISLNGNRRSGIAYEIFEGFYELGISNLPLSSFPILGTLGHFRHFSFPWGGGAYFRLIPSWFFKKGVHSILGKDGAYLFYMHPWEVDPDQPRPEGTGLFSRFKHYTNLGSTEGKLRNLLEKYSECSFVTCHEYLKEMNQTGLTR